MKFQLSSGNDKYARLKIGLIPILILFLGLALFMPKQKPLEIVTSGKKQEDVPTTDNGASSIEASKKMNTPGVNISLAEITAHDPFQLLAILIPKVENRSTISTKQVDAAPKADLLQKAKTDKLALVRESLKSRVVRGIFMSGNKKTVLIDSKMYSEGDLLEKGIRVHQINPHDVVLEIDSSGHISLH